MDKELRVHSSEAEVMESSKLRQINSCIGFSMSSKTQMQRARPCCFDPIREQRGWAATLALKKVTAGEALLLGSHPGVAY